MRHRFIPFEKALKIISKEDLKTYYWDQNHTKEETSKHFNIYIHTLDKLLILYNLKKSKQQIAMDRSKAYFEKTGYLWPTQNKEVLDKRVETWEQNYGESHPNKSQQIQSKRKETCIDKYGVDHPFKLKEIFAKREVTMKAKSEEELQAIREKIEKTQRKKYKGLLYFETEEYKMQKKKSMEEKYGSLENAYKIQHENYVKTMKEKYGVENSFELPQYKQAKEEKKEEIYKKAFETRRKNNSLNTSKPEEEFFSYLKSIYLEEDIIRSYYDEERYPFHCDFYIKSEDLFIECNFHWTHGKMPYIIDDPICVQQLNEWKEKAKKSNFYKNAISIWTDLDVRKLKYFKDNNLNYRVIYDKNKKL